MVYAWKKTSEHIQISVTQSSLTAAFEVIVVAFV